MSNLFVLGVRLLLAIALLGVVSVNVLLTVQLCFVAEGMLTVRLMAGPFLFGVTVKPTFFQSGWTLSIILELYYGIFKHITSLKP